jgi:hypothetical protein
MKTLNKIFATIALITLTAGIAKADNFKTIRMPVSGGKILEIIVKIENTVEEYIPVSSTVRSENKNSATYRTMQLPTYVEETVEEVLPEMDFTSENNTTEASLNLLLAEITKPENEVSEGEVETKAIFESIQKENVFRVTGETLSKVTRPEAEVNEPGIEMIATTVNLAK